MCVFQNSHSTEAYALDYCRLRPGRRSDICTGCSLCCAEHVSRKLENERESRRREEEKGAANLTSVILK